MSRLPVVPPCLESPFLNGKMDPGPWIFWDTEWLEGAVAFVGRLREVLQESAVAMVAGKLPRQEVLFLVIITYSSRDHQPVPCPNTRLTYSILVY